MKTKKIKNGFALIWSLVISMIIMLFVSTMVLLITKELRITSNIDESNRAYMAAEAGMEKALFEVKRKGFGWCGNSAIPGNNVITTIGTNLTYRYVVSAITSATGCQSITVESTGSEANFTHRAIKLTINYGPANKINTYDSSPFAPAMSGTSYIFPATADASDKKFMVQQFDVWDIQSMPNGNQINVGIHQNANNNPVVVIRKINSTTATISLGGRINGLLLTSNVQNFTISASTKFRIITEYARVSDTNYSVVRAIVLLRSVSAGEEIYNCPNSSQSYVVYGTVNGTFPDPLNVWVGTPNPNWTSSGGNGYLRYPSNAKIDNMVFWGRE